MMLNKISKTAVLAPKGDTDLFEFVARRYIRTIHVYDQPRLRTVNTNRSNKRKWFHIKVGKKQMIFTRNYGRHRLHR